MSYSENPKIRHQYHAIANNFFCFFAREKGNCNIKIALSAVVITSEQKNKRENTFQSYRDSKRLSMEAVAQL